MSTEQEVTPNIQYYKSEELGFDYLKERTVTLLTTSDFEFGKLKYKPYTTIDLYQEIYNKKPQNKEEFLKCIDKIVDDIYNVTPIHNFKLEKIDFNLGYDDDDYYNHFNIKVNYYRWETEDEFIVRKTQEKIRKEKERTTASEYVSGCFINAETQFLLNGLRERLKLDANLRESIKELLHD